MNARLWNVIDPATNCPLLEMDGKPTVWPVEAEARKVAERIGGTVQEAIPELKSTFTEVTTALLNACRALPWQTTCEQVDALRAAAIADQREAVKRVVDAMAELAEQDRREADRAMVEKDRRIAELEERLRGSRAGQDDAAKAIKSLEDQVYRANLAAEKAERELAEKSAHDETPVKP